MGKASRLKQVRNDRGILIGCIVVSALLIGTVAFQNLSESNRKTEIAKQELEQKRAAEAKRKEHDRAWIAWRDYAEPLCTDSLPAIREGLDLTKVRRNHMPGKPLVQEGLIVCDRIRVGIVQRNQNRLTLSYVVPKKGWNYPLPSTSPPPPEFAPSHPTNK